MKNSAASFPARSRRWQHQWNLAYYFLAAFDVLTITACLALNHHLSASYEQSVQVNQFWAARLQTYADLAQTASQVNAPGNDVFSSRDVSLETARLEQSMGQFQGQMQRIRQDLQAQTSPILKAQLLQNLDRIDAAMAEMIQEARGVFVYFQRNQLEPAAQQMSIMDQHHAIVNAELEKLRQAVGQIQQQGLQQQGEQAATLKLYEYGITAAGLCMILGVTLYGYRLSRQMETDAQMQTQLIEKLQQNHELKQTLEELHRTQSQMVHGEKMAALGQMVAGVAHEINNPLSFIHSNLSPIERYTQDLLSLVESYQRHYPNPPATLQADLDAVDLEFLSEDSTKVLRSMKVGSDRIRDIVKSLRNFSRLDEGSCKPVDIHEGIDNTLMLLQHRLKPQSDRPGIQIIKTYGQLPAVECYAGQLNQVFMNLLANAIDALEEVYQGQSAVERIAAPLYIWIETQCLEMQTVRISIANNGPEIPMEIRTKLFDPFFTTKTVGKGTGLGLSISYQVVTEKHHGKLWLDSTFIGGTQFVIDLPIAQADSDRHAPSVTSAGTEAATEQIPVQPVSTGHSSTRLASTGQSICLG